MNRVLLENQPAVLISIRPRWCEKIFDGSKTIELRKTAPKKTPFKAYVYETRGFERVGNDTLNCVIGGNGRGAVIGEFVCLDVDTYTKVGTGRGDMDYLRLDKDWYTHPIDYSALCLSKEELEAYGSGKLLYGWHITKAVRYDEPRPLTNFHRPCPNSLYCESCALYQVRAHACGNYALQIERPPQSWMYAEDQT